MPRGQRLATAAVLAVMAAGLVTGCGQTSGQATCQGTTCTATLSGAGALITIDRIKTVVRLDSVGDDGATVSINAKPVPLRVGQTTTIAQTQVTLKSVSDGTVIVVLQPAD
ncbi:hypothetical protein GCM10009765_31530 [Fodinicola feengrottensis]|uniref:DUF5666 domain-containing protein n=1 Tax=Fodinicola feengrottensis TaxID=435914 RepID=A0ABN2H0Q8_9ACTN